MDNDTEMIQQEPQTSMEPEMPPTPVSLRTKVLVSLLTVVLALVSAIPVANYASSPESHSAEIQTLNKQAETVTGLVTVSTAASAAITLIPGGFGTPIADKLVDLSSDFAIVLVAIFLEKYLLTLFGLAAFRVVIPLGCAFFLFGFAASRNPGRKAGAYNLALKLVLFGLVLAFVVPVSVFVSNMVEATYNADVNKAVESATAISNSDVSASDANSSSSSDTSTSSGTETKSSDPVSAFVSWISDMGSAAANTASSAATTLSTGASDLLDAAKSSLNNLIEALAVMIVVNCIIPILVLLFFIWLVNLLFGAFIKLPMPTSIPRIMPHPETLKKK